MYRKLKHGNQLNSTMLKKYFGKFKSFSFLKYIIFIIFSIILVLDFRQYPLNRYPNYDYFWGDAMAVSHYFNIKQAIQNLYYPQINLFSGFGYPNIANLSSYVEPINIINLLFLLNISPIQLLIIRSILSIFALLIGTYKLVYFFTNKSQSSFILSFLVIAFPNIWSIQYLRTYNGIICAAPLLLYFAMSWQKKQDKKYLFYTIAVIHLIGPDLVTVIIILSIYLSYFSALALTKCLSRKDLYLILPMFFGILPFLISFTKLFIDNLSSPEPNISREIITPFAYIKFIALHGLHSFIYPMEGSAIQFYLPISIYIFYISSTAILIKRRNARIYLVFALILVNLSILQLIPYLVPFLAKLVPSYLRWNFFLVPTLVLIFTCVILLKNSFSLKYYLSVGFTSLILEIFFFIINPFEVIFNSPKLSILHTNDSLTLQSLPSPLRFYFPFLHYSPWLNLIIINFCIYFGLIFLLKVFKEENKRHIIFGVIMSLLLVYQAFSINIELRRYMPHWNQVSFDEYRVVNYEKRMGEWIKKFAINDLNFRVLPSGAPYRYGSLYARNMKLIPDTEMNNMYGINSLFAYRETQPRNLSLQYNKLICTDCRKIYYDYAYYPPLASQVSNNPEWLIDSSVKYVISANERINSNKFKLLDTYIYKFIPARYDETETGQLFLYEFIDAEAISSADIGSSSIRSIRGNTIQIDYYDVKKLKIELKFLYSKYYKAYVNNKQVNTDSNSDGFILVSVPSPNGSITIKYERNYSYLGFVGYIIAFVMLFLTKTFFLRIIKGLIPPTR